jgi:hypothetical protein
MQDPKQTVCKRVLGMEGDEVRIPQSTRLGPGRTVKVRTTSCRQDKQYYRGGILKPRRKHCVLIEGKYSRYCTAEKAIFKLLSIEAI